MSLLIESRGVGLGRAHFARRVHTQVVAMTSVLRSAAERADDLVKLRRFVETETVAQACTGETVVDYSLKFKAAQGWNTTWVSGYNNDLLSYVPSLRVLKEGGYEGVTGMFEYGHRGPYTEAVEDLITAKVTELLEKAR